MEVVFKQTVKRLNLWRRTAVGKSAWMKAWLYFSLLPPKQRKELKIQNNEKKGLQISFYTSVLKIMIICYTVPETWHVSDVILTFHFGQFLALLPL